jgi:hypothetical protein
MVISALIGIIRWLWPSLSLCSYVHLLACPAHIFIFSSCRITEQSLQYKSDRNDTGYTTIPTMSQSINFLMLSLLSIPLSYINHFALAVAIKPLIEPVQYVCRRPDVFSHLEVRTTFADITKLDIFLCYVTNFYGQVFNHPLGSLMTASLLGMTTTVFAILSIEAGRKHAYRAQTLAVPIILFFGNVVGISVILPLVWIPFNGVVQYKLKYKHSSSNNYIHPFRVLAIMVAIIFGQILVAALPFMAKNASQLQTALTILQFGPLIYSTIEWSCTFCSGLSYSSYEKYHPITRAEAVQSKISVQQLYVTLAVTNLILHYGIIAYTFVQDMNIMQNMTKVLQNQPSLTSDGFQSVSLAGTYFVWMNLIALIMTFAYWTALDGGMDGLILYSISCLILGPGAGLATYCWVREQSNMRSP